MVWLLLSPFFLTSTCEIETGQDYTFSSILCLLYHCSPSEILRSKGDIVFFFFHFFPFILLINNF